jgi:hypothetical protein
MAKRMFDVFNIKKQKIVVTNSSSTTLESENEDLNIGLDIDITAQKSVENIVDKNFRLGNFNNRPFATNFNSKYKVNTKHRLSYYIIFKLNILQLYLLTKFGTQNRAFHHKHYKTYELLEYGTSKDSINVLLCL